MHTIFKLPIFLFLLFFGGNVRAVIAQVQNEITPQKSIQYDKDFVFRDGIYFTFLDFKNNNPIPKAKIIFNSNKDDKNFLKYVLAKSSFTYIDGFGKEMIRQSDDVWGYCSNGTIYINHGTDYNRVTIIGSICHFVATIPVRVGAADPFYNNQPFGERDQFTYVTDQLIIDFESGKVLSFNVDNMEGLLSRDPALYKEFTALKKRQKRDSIFVYLRKYNEKYPVYFPG